MLSSEDYPSLDEVLQDMSIYGASYPKVILSSYRYVFLMLHVTLSGMLSYGTYSLMVHVILWEMLFYGACLLMILVLVDGLYTDLTLYLICSSSAGCRL